MTMDQNFQMSLIYKCSVSVNWSAIMMYPASTELVSPTPNERETTASNRSFL